MDDDFGMTEYRDPSPLYMASIGAATAGAVIWCLNNWQVVVEFFQ